MDDRLEKIPAEPENRQENEVATTRNRLTPLNDLIKPDGFDPRLELSKARIDPSSPEEEPPIVFAFNGQPVATLGNFSVITGKAKSRKTFFTTLILAANAGCSVNNILFKIETRTAFMDTEQSRFDVQNVQRRIVNMGGNMAVTEFYSLRRYEPGQRMDMIEAYVIDNPEIKLIFIDGVRDLVFDINSQEEATMVIGWLMRLTAEFNIHISMILHQNKGNEDVRGHLGTEAVNKAETVISIRKDGSISWVRPEYSRGKDFEPFTFAIDEHGRPYVHENNLVFVGPATPQRVIDQSEDAHRRRLEKVFEISPNPRYGELLEALDSVFKEEGEEIGQNKLKEYVKQYRQNGYVIQSGKPGTTESRYEYVPQAAPNMLVG